MPEAETTTPRAAKVGDAAIVRTPLGKTPCTATIVKLHKDGRADLIVDGWTVETDKNDKELPNLCLAVRDDLGVKHDSWRLA